MVGQGCWASPVLVAVVVSLFAAEVNAQNDADRRAWAEVAALGEGFVVWESNRDGDAWRIWRRSLDGSGERCISPAEKGRDHACPSVSPDGEWVAYLSLPRGVGYDDVKANATSPLHVMRSDGSDDRVLVPNARRISGGNRAVVWVDEYRLHFLDRDSRARRVDLRTGAVSEPLVGDGGFIPNAAMTYVFDRGHVHPFDAAKKAIRRSGRDLDGCEPTFTSDSRWSVRMSGAGGPITRVDPATSHVHPLLRKDDPRMPRDRGYLYFPMVSPCRRLLAYAASPGQHDHFTSDYDVFVVPINTDTLEPTGRPARYTFHGKTDRYPSVFLSDLPLGRYTGEAPLTVRLSTPDGAAARWQSGDGATGGGATFTHRYPEPGQYTVVATVAERELRGQVTVLPSAPPKVVDAAMVGPRRAWVVFDEAVDVSRARAALASSVGVRPDGLSEDGRKLALRFAADVPEKDELTLTGVRDRAERPNEMPATRVALARAAWPVSRDGLVFAFQSGGPSAVLRTAAGGEFETVSPVLRRLARPDRNRAVELARGACEFPKAGPCIAQAVKASGELSVEVVFRAATRDQSGPARIVTLSRDTGLRDFTIGQEKDRLVLRLRTPSSGANGTNPQVDIGDVDPGREQHVVVTYRDGEGLIVYADGKQSKHPGTYRGDLSNWEEMEFLLGDEATCDRDWCGRIEAVAVYDRALTDGEARRAQEAWEHLLAGRKPVAHWRVETEVMALSPMPTVERAAPYREALLLAEHRVKRAEGEGAPSPGAKLRVAHWALLDGAPVPEAANLRIGGGDWIELEPFDAQPQANGRYMSDELDVELDLPVFLDVTPPRG